MEEKKKSVSGNLVIYTNLVCENTQCGNRKVITKQFEAPGIPYVDYIHESIRITCPGCGIKYKDDPIFGVSADWKGFDNGNDHDSKSEFNTKTTENRDEDGGDGRDDENGNSQGKSTKAQLIIPVVKPHLNKLFTDEYGIPHAGIQRRRPY